MRSIFVNGLKQKPIEEQNFEIVERKGLGHPDSICDGIMNDVSIELSREYLNRVGRILHHNADKSLLVAGKTEVHFGGGVVEEPMLLVMGDRATFEIGDIKIPVEEIAVDAAKRWVKNHLRYVDPIEHMRYQVELKPGSAELTDIFFRKDRVLDANDTSAAVGYAPMSETEKMVLSLEKWLNSKEFKEHFPETGEDIKVMGFRRNRDLNLVVSMAFVDQFINSEEEYFTKKEEILSEIENFVNRSESFESINVALNTLDEKGRGTSGVYLTVLGTSADGADSGQVGRGNRVNGVIPLNRPVCSEAAAGKNPVSHVGKIYNLLTHRIAEDIYRQVDSVIEVYVWLLSKIGQPIDQPMVAVAQIITDESCTVKDVQGRVREIIEFELDNIEDFCMELASGKISVY